MMLLLERDDSNEFFFPALIGIESRMKWEREIEMTIDVNWKENIYFLSIANSQPVFFYYYSDVIFCHCVWGEKFDSSLDLLSILVGISNEDFFFFGVLKISGAKWPGRWWWWMTDLFVALASAWCLWRDLYYFSSGLYRGTSHEYSSPLWTLRLAHRFAFLYAARSQCHDWFTAAHKRGWVAGWGSLFFYTVLLFHPVAFPSVQSVRWSTLHNVHTLSRFRWPRAPPS